LFSQIGDFNHCLGKFRPTEKKIILISNALLAFSLELQSVRIFRQFKLTLSIFKRSTGDFAIGIIEFLPSEKRQLYRNVSQLLLRHASDSAFILLTFTGALQSCSPAGS